MNKAVRWAALMLLSGHGAVFAQSSRNTVLASCGAPTGVANYKADQNWSEDRMPNGSFTFVVDDEAQPNLLFKDASGNITDARADGATVSFTFIDADRNEFGILVNYERAGSVETYGLVRMDDGRSYLQWTVNRVANRLPKVAAYTAACN